MQKYKTTKTISNIRSPTASLQSFLLGWNLCAPLLQQGRPSTQVLVSIVFFEAGNEKNIKKQTLRSTGGTHQKLALCAWGTGWEALEQQKSKRLGGGQNIEPLNLPSEACEYASSMQVFQALQPRVVRCFAIVFSSLRKQRAQQQQWQPRRSQEVQDTTSHASKWAPTHPFQQPWLVSRGMASCAWHDLMPRPWYRAHDMITCKWYDNVRITWCHAQESNTTMWNTVVSCPNHSIHASATIDMVAVALIFHAQRRY